MIVDFPELSPMSWKFLTEREAAFVVARIEHDRHDIQLEPFHLGTYLRCGLDSKVWGFSALYTFTTTNSYAIAYFLPVILREGMGFDIAKAQCLTAPPYIASGIVMFFQAWLGDKMHIRGPIIVFNNLMGKAGPPLPTYSAVLTNYRHTRPRTSRIPQKRWSPLLRRLPRHDCLQF